MELKRFKNYLKLVCEFIFKNICFILILIYILLTYTSILNNFYILYYINNSNKMKENVKKFFTLESVNTTKIKQDVNLRKHDNKNITNVSPPKKKFNVNDFVNSLVLTEQEKNEIVNYYKSKKNLNYLSDPLFFLKLNYFLIQFGFRSNVDVLKINK